MTGFGRGTAAGDRTSVTVEIKTVNNRFLDANIRLPSDLQSLETSIRKQVSGRVSRGRVDVSIQLDRQSTPSYQIDRAMIGAFLTAMQQLKTEFGLAGEPDVNVVARIPNVIVPERNTEDESIADAVAAAVGSALDDLEQMRTTEGDLLAAELEARLDAIAGRLGPIADSASVVTEEIAAKLKKRVTDLLAKLSVSTEIDSGRLAQETAFLADRADISEEIVRLRAHIEHFRAIMKETADVGKRLDFLTQELNREANTIASKTNDLAIKENALSIKSEIEKIREQVQNVE